MEVHFSLFWPSWTIGGGHKWKWSENALKKTITPRWAPLKIYLLKALKVHPQQTHRAVWSWPERDKLSAQWLLCLPGHDSTLTSEEFSQAFTALLCLSSTACADPMRLGEDVWRRVVDRYGDKVVAQALQGDGYRRRHDELKMGRNWFAVWSVQLVLGANTTRGAFQAWEGVQKTRFGARLPPSVRLLEQLEQQVTVVIAQCFEPVCACTAKN